VATKATTATGATGTTTSKPWSSTAPPGEFRPYVAPETILPEFTLRAVLLGILAGLFFGAVTVYVGLRADGVGVHPNFSAFHQHPAGFRQGQHP
jgi:hypothetical protein